ncbi:MAG: hypothetical protein JKY01_02025 [Pseudomonadales bacterium]|nr:hypothetical protein [Pseudomonadales bacterium]
MPPAKSSKPISPSQPPPQTQWVTGEYTSRLQASLKTSIPENFIRSAKPPTMRAGVITAKVSWNNAKRISGISPVRLSRSIPENMTFPNPPIQADPSAKASEYPQISHITDTAQVMAKHCINTDSTFLTRTRPP